MTKWLLVILTIVIVIVIILYNSTNGTYLYKCPTYTGGKIMGELYNQMNLKFTNNSQRASIYLPCGYTWVENELHKHTPKKDQLILAIDGCDKIVAKNGLWKVLSEEYGRGHAAQLTPKSFITNSNTDMQHLAHEYNPNQIYIMKKNVQRQQGLKITTDLTEMLNSNKDGYVVIQEYLMNPLLIDKRKFDIRVYLLVIQKGDTQYYYRHTGGRCHYTSVDFTTTVLARDAHIPSGYTEDSNFKAAHPETLKDLQSYLNEYQQAGDYFFDRLDKMLTECCHAFSKVLGTNKKFKDNNNVRCQLFGLDVLSDENLRPVLIEINKGPELAWSSDIEYQYKKQMLGDMFNLLGQLKSDTPNEFIPILEKMIIKTYNY